MLDVRVSAGILTAGSQLLQELVLTYFSPDTADNLALRQCLSYCIPAFCYSSSENQAHLRKVWTVAGSAKRAGADSDFGLLSAICANLHGAGRSRRGRDRRRFDDASAARDAVGRLD